MKMPLRAALFVSLALTGAAVAKTGTMTFVDGIANNGAVAGSYDTTNFGSNGFSEIGGVYTDIVFRGSVRSGANAINDSNAVLGSYSTVSADGSFLESGGHYTMIQDPAAPASTFAYGLNDSGEISGYYFSSTTGFHGFTDIGGAFSDIDDPSAMGGTVVFGVSSNGYLAGYYFTSGPRVGFVDKGGVFFDVIDPATVPGATFPTAVNASGEVVGTFDDMFGAHGFTDIGGVFTTIDDPLAPVGATYVQGVNDLGEIAGYFQNGDGVFGFVETGGVFTTLTDPSAAGLPLVPEPATWALVVLGAAFAGAQLRLARQSRQGSVAGELSSPPARTATSSGSGVLFTGRPVNFREGGDHRLPRSAPTIASVIPMSAPGPILSRADPTSTSIMP